MKRYFILAGLIFTLIIVASGVYAIYQSKYRVSYSSIDPDTGRAITVNGVSSGEKQSDFVINGGSLLTEKGIATKQYNSLYTILKASSSGYSQVAVNAESIKHDTTTNTYTFKVRLGDIGSSKYIFVTMKVVDESTFDIKIVDDKGKIIKEELSVRV